MKFHLPKKLMVAVLAAMVGATVPAAYADAKLSTPIYVNTITTETTITALPEELITVGTAEDTSTGQPYAMPYVKDGSATLILDGIANKGDSPWVTVQTPLYVREGKVLFQNSKLFYQPFKDGATSVFQVSGKNAELVLDNSDYVNPYVDIRVHPEYIDPFRKEENIKAYNNGAYICVGAADGAGTLTLKNGSRVQASYSLLLGRHSESYWDESYHVPSATTNTTDPASGRYQDGDYTYLETSGRNYGTGTVNILSGSKLQVASALVLSEGTVNVDGEGSLLSDGFVYPTAWSYLSRMNGTTTNLNITNGGSVKLRYGAATGSYFGANNGTANIVIDGKGSNLSVGHTFYLGQGNDSYTDTSCKVDVEITNGGSLSTPNLYLGVYNRTYGKCSVTCAIDKDSTLTASETMYASSDSTITNAGTITTGNLTLNGSTLNMTGETASLVASRIDVTNKALINLEVTTSTKPIITAETLLFDGSANAVSLTYSDKFLSGFTSGETFSFYVANVTNGLFLQEGSEDALKNASLSASNILWSTSALAWKYSDDTQQLYITGTLTKKEVVNLDGEEVTLEEGEVLGGGTSVVNTGTGSITTEDGETAVLPDAAIENEGTLTIGGSYDGKELEIFETPDTRVCVDGKDGNNGYYREGGSAILVVDNKDGAGTLIVEDGTTVKSADGESLKLYASGLATGELDYSEYHIVDTDHAPSIGEIQDMRPQTEAGKTLTIDMTGGTLLVKEGEALSDDTLVKTTGGAIKTEGAVTVGGDQYQIGGTTSVVVDGESEAIITGENDYTGNTVISGDKAQLTVETDKALGNSTVYLQNEGTLDLNSQAVGNEIYVEGCTICDAANYTGNVTVTGNLNLVDNTNEHIARANMVTFVGAGNIASSNATLVVNSVEMAAGATGEINSDLTTNEGGTIILNNGSQLKVNGALTLGKGTTFLLKGNGYAAGSELGYGDPTADSITTGSATLANGRGTFAINENGVIYLTAVFDNSIAEALTVTNWGIATASRAFVNAVRGQRTNTGCIANGRGTAWAAVLGATSDIGSGDVDLKGAAVGADMKVGEKSSLGVAFGYIDGDAKIPGMSKADQEGTYVALYGEHGLRKLSSTSCLSLDWVATYGNTESDWAGMDWEQQSLQLNSRLNWNKKVSDRLCVSVFGGLEYYTCESDTVENVKTGSLQNLRGEIGVGARYVAWGTPGSQPVLDEKGATLAAARPGCEKLVLHGEIRYMNDMVRSNPVIEQDGLRGSGDNPGRQGMGIEAGATYRISERWSASANYGFNTMEDSREHRVNVGASYTF